MKILVLGEGLSFITSHLGIELWSQGSGETVLTFIYLFGSFTFRSTFTAGVVLSPSQALPSLTFTSDSKIPYK